MSLSSFSFSFIVFLLVFVCFVFIQRSLRKNPMFILYRVYFRGERGAFAPIGFSWLSIDLTTHEY